MPCFHGASGDASGHRVFSMRRRRSASTSSLTRMRNGSARNASLIVPAWQRLQIAMDQRQHRTLQRAKSWRATPTLDSTWHRSRTTTIAVVDIVSVVAIARMPLIIIDCPDPGALARFYGAMLEWKVDVYGNRASACAEDGRCIAFHQVSGYTPPTWPTQERPKQMHFDVIVDDLDAAETAVVELGATKHPDQLGTSYRVFLDPAGHPFCLCVE